MQSKLFTDTTTLRVRALFVGERIDLRAMETTQRLAVAPLVVTAGVSGCAILFRYGAVVLFDLSPVEEAAFLVHLNHLINEPFPRPEIEEVVINVDPQRDERVENGGISLRELNVERLQLVADILAKSVVLAYYEAKVAQVFDYIEPLAANLQREGRGGHQGKALLRQIGGTLLIQHKMVARVEMSEKPEILWDHPELERIYLRLQDEYEVRERHVALERKLDLIARTVETLLDLLQHDRSLRVEWYIVILIVIEIFLTLYAMFTGGK